MRRFSSGPPDESTASQRFMAWWGRWAVMPLSMTRVWPVIPRASSLASQQTTPAMSSGSAGHGSRRSAARSASWWSDSASRAMSLMISPGATALQRIPSAPYMVAT